MGDVIGQDFWRKWFPTSVLEAALPHIGAIGGFDWNKPIGQWPKEDMLRFLREVLHILQTQMMKHEKITPFDDEIPFP